LSPTRPQHLKEDMQNITSIYINGRWIDSSSRSRINVYNPASGEVIATVPAGSAEDVGAAVSAAASAFAGWAATPVAERVALLDRIREGLLARREEIARTLSQEMGATYEFAKQGQLGLPIKNLDVAARAMEQLPLEEWIGNSLVVREPIGVVAAITPWNVPLHQITAKVGPALVAGCTVVLKASELSPLSAYQFAEVVHAAGAPAGIFNLVSGDGVAVGEVLVSHPLVDMVSFTGSTRAGKRVAALAAGSIKKVTLELGGKSANIVLADANLDEVIPSALKQCFTNAGQVCAALSRLLVPKDKKAEVEQRVLAELAKWPVGDPFDATTKIGPLASHRQRDNVRAIVTSAIAAGARLLAGGVDVPEALQQGAYVAPTVFTDVTNDMAIAREEIFGPVICIMTYDSEAEAVQIANDSIYGLSGGVWSGDRDHAVAIAMQLRTGQVVVNGAPLDVGAPFGGYRQSGLGREYGRHGLEEYFQYKSILAARAS
jgi:acyl-CoA reductase-like NAD-dependent aldehyde dehydrogenase